VPHQCVHRQDGERQRGGALQRREVDDGGRQPVSERRVAGPGLQEAAPTFDELVLGYLDGDSAAVPEEALA
jgi:hypothetical protein